MSDNQLLIQLAGEAVKGGDRPKARSLLLQAIRQDPRDHLAWLGLARVAASPQASLDYARRAALLKPDDPLVLKVLTWAEKAVSKQVTGNNQQITSNHAAVTQQQTSINQQPATASPQPAKVKPFVWALTVIVVLLLGIGGVWAWSSWGNRATAVAIAPATTIAQVERMLPDSLPETIEEETAVVAINLPATATPTPTQPAIQPKLIAAGKENETRPTWTVTPTPTNTPTPTATPIPTFVSPNNRTASGRPFGVAADERWIDVNLSAQTLTAYEGNTAVYDTYISSGLAAYPTVTGLFRVWLRYESQTMDGTRLGYDYYLENVPYVMYFYEDYALHGTFWHNNFGSPMSHGCVNMYTPDAQWLFNWSSIGTVVNVHY